MSDTITIGQMWHLFNVKDKEIMIAAFVNSGEVMDLATLPFVNSYRVYWYLRYKEGQQWKRVRHKLMQAMASIEGVEDDEGFAIISSLG